MDEKLTKSIKDLEHALTFKGKVKKDFFYFQGISKAFETCLEYAWKHLKKTVEGEGFEALSPRDAIKRAGQMKLIDQVEVWLKCLADRNLAVHDYLGVEDEEYLKRIEIFLKLVQGIKEKK